MKIKRFGPLKYFWGPKKRFLDVFSPNLENCGWEWGSDGTDDDKPIIALRLFGLDVVYLQVFRAGGFHVSFLGFWWLS